MFLPSLREAVTLRVCALVSARLSGLVNVCGVVQLVNRLVSSVNMAHGVDATTRSEWIVVGISGVTCGGKTTLAHRVLSAASPAYGFHQDKYFYPDDSPRHVPCAGLQHNNYDILGALDMESFYQDVVSTMQGDNKAHATVTEMEGREALGGKKLLLLEGFTTLNYNPINELCDLRYYLVLEYWECLARRVLRLYDPPDVEGYFESCVWPEHLRYRAEIERDKRVRLLDGTEPGVFEIVMNDIRALASAR